MCARNSNMAWSTPVPNAVAWARAGGRRRYNRRRFEEAALRRVEIQSRTIGLPRNTPGLQAVLSRALGVSEATISRDMRAIRDAASGALLKPLPRRVGVVKEMQA